MPTKKIINIPSIAVPVKFHFNGSPISTCSINTVKPSKSEREEIIIPRLANKYRGLGEEDIIAEKARFFCFFKKSSG